MSFSANHNYIISENNYFIKGVVSLSPRKEYIPLVPDDIISERVKIFSGFVIIYIKNKIKFREVCNKLSSSGCYIFFFFDINPGLKMKDFISTRFYNARLSLKTFKQSITLCLNDNREHIFSNILSVRLMAAEGLDYFNRWVSIRENNIKSQHNYNRNFLQVLGINNVSVHNMFLAEDIALALMTMNDIKNRQGLLHQKVYSGNLYRLNVKGYTMHQIKHIFSVRGYCAIKK